MRTFVLLGAVLLSSVLSAGAAPTDDSDAAVPSATPEATGEPQAEAGQVTYRKETLDTVSRNSSAENIQTKTKAKEKVKVKHLKNGGTVTVIKDTSRTKTKKALVSDEYSQTNHTLTEGGSEGGVEDSTSLTHDKQHLVKEVDVVKKKDTERIVRDKYGNIISDTKKSQVKEKDRKKEKDKETSKLVHTVKKVPPAEATSEAPAPVEPSGC